MHICYALVIFKRIYNTWKISKFLTYVFHVIDNIPGTLLVSYAGKYSIKCVCVCMRVHVYVLTLNVAVTCRNCALGTLSIRCTFYHKWEKGQPGPRSPRAHFRIAFGILVGQGLG